MNATTIKDTTMKHRTFEFFMDFTGVIIISVMAISLIIYMVTR